MILGFMTHFAQGCLLNVTLLICNYFQHKLQFKIVRIENIFQCNKNNKNGKPSYKTCILCQTKRNYRAFKQVYRNIMEILIQIF